MQGVVRGEHGHPTQNRTRVYRVPNMHSDRNAKEPGSMAWQSEHILICSDDHTALTFGKGTLVLLAHRHSLRIHQPYFSHPEHPTQVLHPSMGSLKQGSTYLGILHTVLQACLR